MSFMQCGNAVHYYRLRPGAPQAPWLVLINGLGTDHRIWDALLEALPARHSVLVYDLRGQGLSELGQQPYDVAELSSDLELMLQRLGAGSVIPVGFSMGGLVAQQFALAHPGRARGLVLVATGMRIATPQLWRERAAQVRQGGVAAIVDGSMQRWFSATFRERQPHLVRGYRSLLGRVEAAGYLAGVELLAETDLSASVAQLSLPTLAIAGSVDPATPPELMRELVGQIRGAELRVMAGSGHMISIEQPEALARSISDFVDGQTEEARGV
jgi:3-oxoadipate enol-lactonase